MNLNRILIIKLWALGDVIMTIPLADALKRQNPDCRISWMVDACHADILEGHPLVDEVIPFDSGAWRRDLRRGHVGSYLRTLFSLRRRLAGSRFDTVINLTPEKTWTRLFSLAPLRVALYPHPAKGIAPNFYTTTIARPPGDQTHNSDYALKALGALGISGAEGRMSLCVDDGRAGRVRALLATAFPADQTGPLVVVHPGTSQETKCWPPPYFSRLVERLASSARVIITGSPAEADLGREIVSGAKSGRNAVLNAAGKLTHILDTAMLVREAAVVVTGDTSILHIASAFDVPVVGIYGGTRPGRNAARSSRSVALFNDTVSCSPCYLAHCRLPEPLRLSCMSLIEVDMVYDAVDALLRSQAGMAGAEAA